MVLSDDIDETQFVKMPAPVAHRDLNVLSILFTQRASPSRRRPELRNWLFSQLEGALPLNDRHPRLPPRLGRREPSSCTSGKSGSIRGRWR